VDGAVLKIMPAKFALASDLLKDERAALAARRPARGRSLTNSEVRAENPP
jgi:hypothetical protein